MLLWLIIPCIQIYNNISEEYIAIIFGIEGTDSMYLKMLAPHSRLNIYINQKTTVLISIALNPLKPELNPICYLLALLGAHHFLHVSRITVKSLTFKLLMSYIYIYMEHPFLMFLDHMQRLSTVGRTPLDE